MGILSQGFKCMCTTLFFLFLLSYTVSSHSSNQEIQPSSTTPSHYHQLFYLKNTNPMFSSRSQERFKKRRIKRNKNMKHKKKKVKNLELRPFSVMLPKGFVPPSGSSPCHNDQPNSVSFECHLTSAEP
ncbi:uncharacterized protein LOC133316587 [Gastrolobium bilobum]|uniref:uncharacterized protein LOC133316587 n=1 Tax=Gastrolobium bilobum TaxID=150636 RepID=UPI002AB1AD64|nr:uncharacterized protein LOC133316587 [Gastrolobium bilobum]